MCVRGRNWLLVPGFYCRSLLTHGLGLFCDVCQRPQSVHVPLDPSSSSSVSRFTNPICVYCMYYSSLRRINIKRGEAEGVGAQSVASIILDSSSSSRLLLLLLGVGAHSVTSGSIHVKWQPLGWRAHGRKASRTRARSRG